jgi:hypothetical protein
VHCGSNTQYLTAPLPVRSANHLLPEGEGFISPSPRSELQFCSLLLWERAGVRAGMIDDALRGTAAPSSGSLREPPSPTGRRVYFPLSQERSSILISAVLREGWWANRAGLPSGTRPHPVRFANHLLPEGEGFHGPRGYFSPHPSRCARHLLPEGEGFVSRLSPLVSHPSTGSHLGTTQTTLQDR